MHVYRAATAPFRGPALSLVHPSHPQIAFRGFFPHHHPSMANSANKGAGDSAASPLNAFTGSFAPTKTGALYKIGLAIVAFAMVLLPLIYVALIGLTAWAVLLHLRYDTWLFDGGGSGRGGIARLLLYLGPAVAGGILVFFMVKPFFAAKEKSADPI